MNRKPTVVVLIASFFWIAGTTPAQWPNYPITGTPRLPNGKPNLRAAAPRMPDGKPDLSGISAGDCLRADECRGQSLFFDLARDLKASDVQMTPWAAGIQAQRVSRDHVDDPLADCLPAGVPRMLFQGAFKILETPVVTAFLHEGYPGQLFRQVLTDGRPLPQMSDHTWMGYSIGRWEGDAFVVETEGFRDGGWLDTLKAHPHSDELCDSPSDTGGSTLAAST